MDIENARIFNIKPLFEEASTYYREMEARNIEKICKVLDRQIAKGYLGTFAIDTIPYFEVRPGRWCVVNTHPLAKMGEHWVALFYDKKGGAEYFCSYGRPPKARFMKILKKIFPPNYKRNLIQLQSPNTTVCGQYCIYYLYYRSRGKSMKWIQNKFSKVNLMENDRKVRKFVLEKYNFSTPLLDLDFLQPRQLDDLVLERSE